MADKTPEWASDICGVEPETLRGAARLIATSSSCACQWGLAFEQQIAALGVTESVADIMAITGNIDNPGGNALYRCAFLIEKRYGLGDEYIDPEVYAKKLIPATSGINESNIVSCADTDAILAAIETGEPYPIQMFWIQSSNALACASMDPARTRAALMKVPFIVVADPFMTPTAQAVADIVLPVAMSCERNSCRTWWTPVRTMVKVTDYYEAKSDEQICLELGKRIKPEHWPWEDDKEWCTWYLNDQLNPNGTEYDRTWEDTVQNPSGDAEDATAKLQRHGVLGLGRHVPQVREGHAAPRRPAGLQHAHRAHRAVVVRLRPLGRRPAALPHRAAREPALHARDLRGVPASSSPAAGAPSSSSIRSTASCPPCASSTPTRSSW